MATVTVLLGRELVQRVRLNEKSVHMIGRHENADIILENMLVSRRHARLIKKNGLWFVEDLSGKNGLTVNGHKVKETVVHNKDIIEIAKYSLKFEQSQDELDRERALAKNEPGATFKTSYKTLSGEREIQRKNIPVSSSESTMAASPEQLAALRKSMANRRKAHLEALSDMLQPIYALDKASVTIGRGVEADIKIQGGLTTGKIHAKFTKSGENWYIEHVSGFSGTKVNGEKLSQKRLADDDVIEIGGNKLKFVDKI